MSNRFFPPVDRFDSFLAGMMLSAVVLSDGLAWYWAIILPLYIIWMIVRLVINSKRFNENTKAI